MARGAGARIGYGQKDKTEKPRDPKLKQPGESREAYKARSEKAAKASRDKLAETMRQKTAEGKARRYGSGSSTAETKSTKPSRTVTEKSASMTTPSGGKATMSWSRNKGPSSVTIKGANPNPVKRATKTRSAIDRPKAPKAATTGGGGQARHDAGKGMSQRPGVGSAAGGGNSSKGRKLLSKLGKAWRNRDADKARKEWGID